jgi:TnpA family transposase
VQQNYIRAETLTRANAHLVDTQATIPLAQAWGGGEVASADGLRFVVLVRTINAGPNRKYFNADRGVTYYNFTSDQFTGFHAIVIPGTLRDSMYILDGLLEHQTKLRPVEIMTDTAGVRLPCPASCRTAWRTIFMTGWPILTTMRTGTTSPSRRRTPV